MVPRDFVAVLDELGLLDQLQVTSDTPSAGVRLLHLDPGHGTGDPNGAMPAAEAITSRHRKAQVCPCAYNTGAWGPLDPGRCRWLEALVHLCGFTQETGLHARPHLVGLARSALAEARRRPDLMTPAADWIVEAAARRLGRLGTSWRWRRARSRVVVAGAGRWVWALEPAEPALAHARHVTWDADGRRVALIPAGAHGARREAVPDDGYTLDEVHQSLQVAPFDLLAGMVAALRAS